MPFFREGDHPQTGIPNARCYPFTFGFRLASGRVTPCTLQGQAAEFAFGPHGVDAAPVDGQGFGISLHSHKHSGGTGVPVLAGGAINPGDEIIVGMANFTNNDGDTVSLPCAKAVGSAVDGDYVVGKYVGTLTITGADTDINRPSVAWESYDIPRRVVGDITAPSTFSFQIDLAAIAADGDVITGFAPGFAGTILSTAFVVNVPATTADKAVTLNLEINATNVTGGVIALTSANVIADAVIAGTAVTANNAFDADDTISVEATGVTAFVEGTGTLIITYEVTPA